jgi:hypothetical protein
VVGLNEVTAGAASTLKALVKEAEPLSSVIDRL